MTKAVRKERRAGGRVEAHASRIIEAGALNNSESTHGLELTWDYDNGEIETTGNPDWVVMHNCVKTYGFCTIIQNLKQAIEISFTTGMFEDGNEWVALVAWEGCRGPEIIKGEITFGDVYDVKTGNIEEACLWFEGLNDKLNKFLKTFD